MRLWRALAEGSLGGKVFLCNSGAEAIEAALKLARRARPGGAIVVLTRASTAAPSGPSRPPPRSPSRRPSRRWCRASRSSRRTPRRSRRRSTRHRRGAARADPGRVRDPRARRRGARAAREACDRAGAALIFDEIQTGMGGRVPVGLRADRRRSRRPHLGQGARRRPADRRARHRPRGSPTSSQPGDHGSTFAGGPLVARRRSRRSNLLRPRAARARRRARCSSARGPGRPARRGRGPRPRPHGRGRSRGGSAPELARRALSSSVSSSTRQGPRRSASSRRSSSPKRRSTTRSGVCGPSCPRSAVGGPEHDDELLVPAGTSLDAAAGALLARCPSASGGPRPARRSTSTPSTGARTRAASASCTRRGGSRALSHGGRLGPRHGARAPPDPAARLAGLPEGELRAVLAPRRSTCTPCCQHGAGLQPRADVRPARRRGQDGRAPAPRLARRARAGSVDGAAAPAPSSRACGARRLAALRAALVEELGFVAAHEPLGDEAVRATGAAGRGDGAGVGSDGAGRPPGMSSPRCSPPSSASSRRTRTVRRRHRHRAPPRPARRRPAHARGPARLRGVFAPRFIEPMRAEFRWLQAATGPTQGPRHRPPRLRGACGHGHAGARRPARAAARRARGPAPPRVRGHAALAALRALRRAAGRVAAGAWCVCVARRSATMFGTAGSEAGPARSPVRLRRADRDTRRGADPRALPPHGAHGYARSIRELARGAPRAAQEGQGAALPARAVRAPLYPAEVVKPLVKALKGLQDVSAATRTARSRRPPALAAGRGRPGSGRGGGAGGHRRADPAPDRGREAAQAQFKEHFAAFAAGAQRRFVKETFR